MGAPRITPEEIIEMQRLYRQLGTYTAVANEMGRSPSSVSKNPTAPSFARPIRCRPVNGEPLFLVQVISRKNSQLGKQGTDKDWIAFEVDYLRHYVPFQRLRFARSSMEKQKICQGVHVVCNGSPSRIFRVRRISFGMTMRPRSSTRRPIPVAFIDHFSFFSAKRRIFFPVAVFAGKGEICMSGEAEHVRKILHYQSGYIGRAISMRAGSRP